MKLIIATFDETQHQHLIEPLTELLHEAYRPLAEAGFKYLATHQDAGLTRRRLLRGDSFLAFWDSQLAGTISHIQANPIASANTTASRAWCIWANTRSGLT